MVRLLFDGRPLRLLVSVDAANAVATDGVLCRHISIVSSSIHVVRVLKLTKTDLPVDLTHAFSISGGGTGRTEEDIHLLERQALGLREEEPDEASTEEGEDTEEDVGAVLEVDDHRGGDLTDDELCGVLAGHEIVQRT